MAGAGDRGDYLLVPDLLCEIEGPGSQVTRETPGVVEQKS